jgi:SrtB family sortase
MNNLNSEKSMNNRIASALQKIEPDKSAEERIFSQIVDRAAQERGNYMRTNIMLLSASLVACMVIAVSVIFLPDMLRQNDMIDSGRIEHSEKDFTLLPVEHEILPEYRALYSENNDMVGYIRIGGTDIDYAVVQIDNNEFYLNNNFSKEPDMTGWIFADYRNRFNSGELSDNTILFGHNIVNGKRFTGLTAYYVSAAGGCFDFYRENPVIQFDTLYNKYEWKIFAVGLFNTQPELGEVFEYWSTMEFAGKNEFYSYISEINKRSVLTNRDVDVEYGDKLLTLSTCYWVSGPETDTKLVVFARQVRVGESSEVDVDSAEYHLYE